MNEKYFIIANLGYDGLAINTYNSLEDAEKAYKVELESLKRQHIDGCAMIKGMVIKRDADVDFD